MLAFTFKSAPTAYRRQPPQHRRKSALSAFMLSAFLVAAGGADLARAQVLETLLGSWSGRGSVVFKDNKTETIKCNAYNTGGGTALNLVIRCASTSYKIEIRSKLTKSGSSLAGHWEERTFNAAGEASGRITDGSLALAISGGGFTGQMNATFSARSQTVRIATQGIELRSVDISLTRSQ